MRNCGFETGFSLSDIDYEKAELEKEIQEELYYSEDVYETENIRGDEYFKITYSYNDHYGQKRKTFYILIKKMKSKEQFHPIDKQRNELKWIKCTFGGQGACSIKIHRHGENASLSSHNYDYDHYWQEKEPFSPKILFHKGDQKKVNQRLIESLREALLESRKEIEKVTKKIEGKLAQFKKELDNPFVPDNILSIALESVEKQLDDVKLRRKDCDRLKSLIPKTSSPSRKRKRKPTPRAKSSRR